MIDEVRLSFQTMVMLKASIDRLREGAFQIDIHSPDDETPIEGFLTIRDRLHVYTKKALYQVQLADSIDPDRTNINVPNTYQRVLLAGSDSVSFCKTMLTAKALFNNSLTPDYLNVDALMRIAFDASDELVALDVILEDLRRKGSGCERSTEGCAPEASRACSSKHGWARNHLEK